MSQNLDLNFAVFRAGVFTHSVGDLGRLYHPQDPGNDLLRFLTLECVWEISGPVWRRDFLEKIGCFDEALLSMQDLEMHVRAISARARYICFPDVDHDIRWQDDSTKTSVRHFKDSAYVEAADSIRVKLLNTVRCNDLLTWSCQRALVGLCFGAAEFWAKSGKLGPAVQTWNRGCHQQQAPWYLQIQGILMLCVERVGRDDDGVCARLVNKWKGWARFRQEPALVGHAKESALCDSK